MIRAMPTASLRSLLLICIFRAALACLASMQMTGNPSLFSSVQSHVAVGPVSSPIRTTCGAWDLMNVAIASGSEGTTPSRAIFPVRSTMQIAVSFNDTSSPTYCSIAALHDCKPHEVGLVDSWRADSQSLSMARARNYPMCKNSTRYDRTRNFGLYGRAESKKTQKFVFRSALRPNQISFSHGPDPERTSKPLNDVPRSRYTRA